MDSSESIWCGTDKKALQDFNRLLEKEREIDARQADARKQADSLLRAKKEVEKQAAKLKAAAQAHSGSASSREAQLQSELEKCMVTKLL